MEPPDVLFRFLIDHLPEGALIAEDGCLSFVNPALARMLGYAVPELLRRRVSEIVAPEDAHLVLGQKQSGDVALAHHEVRLRHRDGKTRVHALMDIGAIRFSGKTALIGIVRDVAARKYAKEALLPVRFDPEKPDRRRAEEMRRRSDRQLLKSFMMMPALMALIRLDDAVFLDVNQMFCDVIGLDRQHIIGRSAAELGVLDCRRIPTLDVTRRMREPFTSEIVPFRTHRGEDRYGLQSSHVIEIGDEPCVLIVVQDVTEHRNTQQALVEREATLRKKTKKLEEVSTTLKTLLDMRDEDRRGHDKQVQAAICDTVLPHLKKLKNTGGLDRSSRERMEQLENTLLGICSPYWNSVKAIHAILTPREAEVAGMIRMGKKTKEIADALSVSPGTVETHRNRIRKKLGLPDKKERLINHLRKLS